MLSIVIRDSNKIYMDALRTVLNQYFTDGDIQVVFAESDCNVLAHADLVFQAVEDETHYFDALPFLGRHFTGVIFPVCEYEVNKIITSQRHTCIQEHPIIYRQDPPSTVIQKVSRQLSRLHETDKYPYKKVMRKKCDICDMNQMTKNEIEVLILISQEYCLTAIANILNKSVKTVYSQKKSAMNKLNITSNIGLYAFLRNSGFVE
jgi:fimbrial protein FimW